ncbi:MULTISPECIES: hypothetical protein [unclassified Pseudomonas]|uniref:hypothetical protein n=1 Tax=unclassified Pseudomonas TaxID=196821 RepID=UPI000C87B66D|nr:MULTISPECIES: hypothetical protein [unclassified Pseudomonas]PMU11720.1 hypothetical protein C1Y11_04075 [Pseudomonas sp. FW305-20]PMU15392.1 hypothetical protein C1Y10_22495 [Pseudomonas sp. FW305-122]PMU43235.1 hypothetical protein C1Y12_03450 [Pseudomonas sp. FW305-47B]PMX63526.1 hypothetical protein C1X12_22635 [Pseudomonas sp. FW305-60]PMX64560.1 hypothetical protein C1Y13_04245 [Pseudomonas sp. FW305-33]
MTETNTNSETPSDLLAEANANFEIDRAAYQMAQSRFLEIANETKRLISAAEALEAEAEASNSQWKHLAEQQNVDQRKVNAEIERSIQAKQKAKTIRMTAEARAELVKQTALAMAEARFKLTASAASINASDLEQRLVSLMTDKDFLITARSAYSICEVQCMAALRAVEQPTAPVDIRDVDADAWRKFSVRLMRLLKQDARPAVANLATVPTPVSGEIIATSLVGLNRLRATGGSMPASDGHRREFQLKQV